MHLTHHPRAQQQRRIRRHIHRSNADTFSTLLARAELLGEVESLVPPHRKRVFSPTETLSMFLTQALSADRSCQKAVNDTAVTRMARGLPHCSTHTGAYCRARQRLPIAMLSTLVRQTGQRISAQAPEPWRWRGRPVRLVDGTTVVLPDTPANQTAYPQPRSQKPGLGFPLCRVVGLLCLESGAVLNAAIGRYQGKGGDEQTLLRSILHTLERGDLLVGDAFYATYFLLCSLRELGIDAVFEQYGARQRRTDFRCGQRLGPRDHLIVLQKPPTKPDWMTQADYDHAPSTLMVRELRTGGKILVTTLLCPRATHKSALKGLFRSRWHVELDLRHIKSTLGMERLSCQTPAMARKEMWVYLLAYNLIRLLMVQAALHTGSQPRRLSFKHTLQLWIARDHHGQGIDRDAMHEGLLVLIAQQRVGNRPGRLEPRAIKRRPKPYPLLIKPRMIAREDIRNYGHPKKLK